MGMGGFIAAGAAKGFSEGLDRLIKQKQFEAEQALKAQQDEQAYQRKRADQKSDTEAKFAHDKEMLDLRQKNSMEITRYKQGEINSRRASGGGGGGRSGKPADLSPSLRSDIEERFGGDYKTSDAVIGETLRLMQDEGLSQTAAYNRAVGGMVYQTPATEGGMWPWSEDAKPAQRSTDGTGEFTGQFDYGGNTVDAATGLDAAAPAEAAGGAGAPAKTPPPGDARKEMVLQQARDAIAKGAPAAQVKSRLQSMGIDPGEL